MFIDQKILEDLATQLKLWIQDDTQTTFTAYVNGKSLKLAKIVEGEAKPVLEEVLCPDCGSPMKSRTGKYGVFWGCSKYPKCSGTRDSMGRSREDRDREKAQQDDKDAATDNDRYRFRKG